MLTAENAISAISATISAYSTIDAPVSEFRMPLNLFMARSIGLAVTQLGKPADPSGAGLSTRVGGPTARATGSRCQMPYMESTISPSTTALSASICSAPASRAAWNVAS